MIDAIRLSAPLPRLSAAPVPRAPAVAAPPLDTVSLGPAAPGSRFWSECATQGWIAGSTAGHATAGPIGSAISGQAKADLKALTQALADKGVAIWRERTLHMSNADRFEKLEPERAAQAVLDQPSRFSPILLAQVGDGMLVPIRDLDQLHAVDAFHGSADPASLSRPRLATTLRHAADQGVRFVAHTSGPTEVPTYWAYEILRGQEPLASGVTWSAERQSQHLSDEQQTLVQAFLESDGTADGIAHAGLVTDLKAARAEGISFLTNRRDPEEMSAFDAYDALVRDGATPQRIGLGVAGVRLADCDRGDFGTARDSLKPWLSVYHEVLEPSGRRDHELKLVMERLVQVPPDRVRMTAAVLLDLFTAIEKSDRVSSYEVRDKVASTYDWLAQRMPALDRPEPQVRALIGWIEACGPDEARKAAEIAWDGLSRSHPVPADYQAALGQFDTLLRGLRDVKAADAALRVVSVPVGASTPEQRLAGYERLLALHPPLKTDRWDRSEGLRERATEAAADYLAVATAAGRNGASMEALVDQFALLGGALEKVHQAGEARATFEFIENGLHDGAFGPLDREAVTMRFLEGLVKSGDAEAARVGTLRAVASPGPADTVTRGQDEVVIGGIRVPVRRGN